MKKTMLKRYLWLSLAIAVLLLVAPLPVSALGVNPDELNFRVYPGRTSTRTLDVINDGDQATTYSIYVDEEYESWFTISPDEITLGPQQSGEVEIIVSPPLTTLGEHTAFIYVTSAQQSSGLQVALGIKLKANITVNVAGYALSILENIMPYLIVAVGVGVVVVLFIFVVVRPRRRNYY